MNNPDRGSLLTVLALLFGLLAVSDLAKPLAASLGGGLRPGFVLFGHRLSGTANAVVGPLPPRIRGGHLAHATLGVADGHRICRLRDPTRTFQGSGFQPTQ